MSHNRDPIIVHSLKAPIATGKGKSAITVGGHPVLVWHVLTACIGLGAALSAVLLAIF